ncbi:MAG: hypothetical protein IPO27_02690 [Bacteroidetes bacterium]|nr:hypothetical protein [Bacteroidota bacterium]
MDDEKDQKTIPKLKKEMEKLKLIIAEAETNNKRLTVSSETNITLAGVV